MSLTPSGSPPKRTVPGAPGSRRPSARELARRRMSPTGAGTWSASLPFTRRSSRPEVSGTGEASKCRTVVSRSSSSTRASVRNTRRMPEGIRETNSMNVSGYCSTVQAGSRRGSTPAVPRSRASAPRISTGPSTIGIRRTRTPVAVPTKSAPLCRIYVRTRRTARPEPGRAVETAGHMVLWTVTRRSRRPISRIVPLARTSQVGEACSQPFEATITFSLPGRNRSTYESASSPSRRMTSSS